MKTCVGELEAAVKAGKEEQVEAAKQQLLSEGISCRIGFLMLF